MSYSNPDLLRRIRQGDSQAIAQWLTQQLQPWGITAKVQVQTEALQIILESNPVPDPEWAVAWLKQHFFPLEMGGIQTLKLLARPQGTALPSWSRDLSWPPPTLSLPQKNSQLRELAGQGNAAAMTLLINRALEHKNITATVKYQEPDLEIMLSAATPCDRNIVTTLIQRELQHWQGLNWQSLTLKTEAESELDWQETLTPSSLGQPASVAQTTPIAGPTNAHPQPGEGATKTAVKYELGMPIREIDPPGWQALAGGIFLSLLLIASPQVTFLLSPLITLVHELGHAFAAWGFGYPAIPAFDFMYGGGITLHGDRWPGLVFLVYIGLGYLLFSYRYNRITCRVLWVVIALYSLCAFTELHQLIFVGMGHGFELIFAGIFLYRGISGFGCRYGIERPLYAMISFFIVIYNLRFSWGLMFDSVARAIYEEGKGGLLDHDFVRLARDYFHVDLSMVAGGFLLLTLLTPILIFILYRYWQLILYLFARLFLVKID